MKNQKLRVDNLKHGYLFLIVLIFFTIEFFTERYDILTLQRVSIFALLYIGIRNLIELVATIYLDKQL